MVDLRPVCQEDCQILFIWANDEVTRANSINTSVITWNTHMQWFREKMDSLKSCLYIITDNDKPVGQIRLDIVDEGSAEISLSVAPQHRGKGYAALGISLALQKVMRDGFCYRVVAKVKAGNKASVKSFINAGFKYSGDKIVQNTHCHIFNYIMQKIN
ncbi:MAG: Acetyltransferase (GNAT) family protein [Pelotomaculum sp. PtaB.Bin104]|nr:MAG: Acetyltransferase (GNAT) family protein [Pelotomaculum sp. PtaB.Bin104]